MDILRCYKILELDREASIDETREAYIDMARVWHPDRFTDNPRLRKKAEERLKEINVAYAEIRAGLSTDRGALRTNQTARRKREVLDAINKTILVIKKMSNNLYSRTCLIFRRTDFKQIFRQILYPKIELGKIADRKKGDNDNLSKRAGDKKDSQDRHRNFSDIYEEVARAKQEGRKS